MRTVPSESRWLTKKIRFDLTFRKRVTGGTEYSPVSAASRLYQFENPSFRGWRGRCLLDAIKESDFRGGIRERA